MRFPNLGGHLRPSRPDDRPAPVTPKGMTQYSRGLSDGLEMMASMMLRLPDAIQREGQYQGPIPDELYEWITEARIRSGTRCGRIMLGSGGDTFDPSCDLAKGHDGVCKSRAAIDQNRIP